LVAGKPVSLKAQAVRLLARREYARVDLEQRLLADDTESLDLLHLVVGVGDDPMAAQQLRGDIAGIRRRTCVPDSAPRAERRRGATPG